MLSGSKVTKQNAVLEFLANLKKDFAISSDDLLNKYNKTLKNSDVCELITTLEQQTECHQDLAKLIPTISNSEIDWSDILVVIRNYVTTSNAISDELVSLLLCLCIKSSKASYSDSYQPTKSICKIDLFIGLLHLDQLE